MHTVVLSNVNADAAAADYIIFYGFTRQKGLEELLAFFTNMCDCAYGFRHENETELVRSIVYAKKNILHPCYPKFTIQNGDFFYNMHGTFSTRRKE